MVQPQLVDYIASQVKLGVSRDAIKSALVGAGWMEIDIEDTLKKIEGGAAAPASASAKPASLSASAATTSSGASPKGAEPQSVRVSDLIAASGSATSFLSKGQASSGKNKFDVAAKPTEPQKLSMKNDIAAAADPPSKKGLIVKIVGAVLIAGFAGAAGYFYYQNTGLSAEIAKLSGESNNVNAQLSSLMNQVQAMSASNTALTGQISSLMEENQTLLGNLSFAAVPPLSSGNAATETVSIAGALRNVKSSYELTTPYGVLVVVQNSKDPGVDAALKPLLGTATSVALTGTHIPGSQYLVVTAINGASLAASSTPAATSTASATSTPSAK